MNNPEDCQEKTNNVGGLVGSVIAELDAIEAPAGVDTHDRLADIDRTNTPRPGPSPERLAQIAREIERRKRESLTAKVYDLIDDYRKTDAGRAAYNDARREEYAAEVLETEQRQVREYRAAPAGLDPLEAKRKQKAQSKARLKARLTPEEIEAKREAAKLYMRERRAAKVRT